MPRLSLRGEQGGVPSPSIFEHLWETSAGPSCPQHHPWPGDPPTSAPCRGHRGAGTVGTAALLWGNRGGTPAPHSLVEPGRGKISSRGLPGMCPISRARLLGMGSCALVHTWGTDRACKNPAGVSVGLGRPRAGAVLPCWRVPGVLWPGTCSAVNGLYALV